MGRKREYQLGQYWLGKRDKSPHWYRCWIEGRAIKRVSLGTDDFEAAKQKLDEWWAAQYQLKNDDRPPQEVLLADVLIDYWNGQGSKLASAETVKIALRYWNEFWGEASVADVRNPSRQDKFREALAGRGLNPTSVSRCLEIGRAAIRRAWKRGAISSYPHVEVPLVRETPPKGRPLTVEEVGKLLVGTSEKHMQLFILLLLGTAARPGAIFDLTWKQVDFENGLIHLNPDGRAQTSKRRPTVRLPTVIRSVLEPMTKDTPRVLMFRGRVIEKVDTGWHKMVRRSKLEGHVTPYSLRHTAARWMRMKSVPMEQVAGQLGHVIPDHGMTMRYAPHDPAHLALACAALDELVGLVKPAASHLLATPEQEPVRHRRKMK